MPFVITSPCRGSRDASCVDVCPVDAIHPLPGVPAFDVHDQLFIDPISCIECGACEAVCPAEAIFAHPDVPVEYHEDIARNAAHFAV